jgi:hypothetical protein
MVAKAECDKSLVESLIELANELDGLADLGISVFAMESADVALFRHAYIMKHRGNIRRIVDDVTSLTTPLAHTNEWSRIHAELKAGADQLTTSLGELERFRDLDPESMRILTEAFRCGWESLHRLIVTIGTTAGVLHDDWYSPIRERHDSCRTRIVQLFEMLSEFASAPAVA